MTVYCVSITFLLAFERGGKVLKRLGVKGLRAKFKGLKSEVQRIGSGRECGKSEKVRVPLLLY